MAKTSRTSSANGNGGGKWCRPSTRLAVYLRDGFACAYCGRDLHGAAPHDVTLDHITTRARGGSHAPTNLVTACRACNSARQDATVASWGGAELAVALRRQARRSLTPYRRLALAILAGNAGREDTIKRLRAA